MTDVNVPLLRKAVEWVEAEAAKPRKNREWFQGMWITPEEDMVEYYGRGHGCGTAYCVAGYVGQMLDPRYAKSQVVDDVHVSYFAEEKLGLPDGHELFAASNSAVRIRTLAEQYAGEKL